MWTEYWKKWGQLTPKTPWLRGLWQELKTKTESCSEKNDNSRWKQSRTSMYVCGRGPRLTSFFTFHCLSDAVLWMQRWTVIREKCSEEAGKLLFRMWGTKFVGGGCSAKHSDSVHDMNVFERPSVTSHELDWLKQWSLVDLLCSDESPPSLYKTINSKLTNL